MILIFLVMVGKFMSILMGDNVELRKKYIFEHSKDKSIQIDV